MWRKKEEKYAKTQAPKYLAALPFTHKMSSLICNKIKQDKNRNAEKKRKKYAKTQPPKYLAALPFTHKMSSLICKNT